MHADQGHAHQDVGDHRDHDEEGAEASIHVRESSMAGGVCLPVYEAPGVRVLELCLPQTHAWHGTEEDVGNVDCKQSERCQFLIHIMVVEVGMVDGQVPFYGHGANDAESRQAKEEEDEAAVFTQGLATRPFMFQVGSNSHWADQASPQEVGDSQSTDQGVEGGLFLLLPGLAKDHNGYEVPHDSENEHDHGDGQGFAALSQSTCPIRGAVGSGEHGGVQRHGKP